MPVSKTCPPPARRNSPVASARRALELQTLFAIAGAIALGLALLNSGAVHFIAHSAVATVGGWGPYAVLAAIAVLTMLFTEVVTNTAAAALMFPLGVAMALDLGVDPVGRAGNTGDAYFLEAGIGIPPCTFANR